MRFRHLYAAKVRELTLPDEATVPDGAKGFRDENRVLVVRFRPWPPNQTLAFALGFFVSGLDGLEFMRGLDSLLV